MQHIDRLLIEAKKAFRPNGKTGVAFVDYDNEKRKWIVSSCMVWEGVFGSGNMAKERSHETEFCTQEEASEAMHKYFEEYGIENEDAVVIFIDRLED